jgi:hypothetical protein
LKNNNEIKNLIDSTSNNKDGNNIIENNFSPLDWYKNLMEKLDNMNLDELFYFFSIMSLILITLCLISIFFIYINIYVINKFKLEEKYPRFKSIFRLRLKLNDWSVKFNVFLISLASLNWIIVYFYVKFFI